MGSPHGACQAQVHTCSGILQRLPLIPGIPIHTPAGNSRFCQQQNSISRLTLHTQTPRESCSPSAGCRQVKQTLAEFPEQLQRFHSPGISLAPAFGLAAPTTSPMPEKGCSTLEAPGWLLTLVSPFHGLFPTTTDLQGPDLQCMAGVLRAPSLSLKDGLAPLAQEAPHYTPEQTLLPRSSSHQPETRFSKPKLEPPRSPPDLQDKDLTPATLAASLEHNFCCHQEKASI